MAASEEPIYGKGFILTRRVVRQQHLEMIELWLATDTGPVCLYSPPQTNVCFVAQSQEPAARAALRHHTSRISFEQTVLKTLSGKPLALIRFSPDVTSHALRTSLEHAGITAYEADIKLTDRFLMERFAYGGVSYKARPGTDNVLTDAAIKGAQYRPTLTTLSLDIECDEHENLFSVGLASPDCKKVLMISEHPIQAASADDFDIEHCANEHALLKRLVYWVTRTDPDVIIGWNVKQFDMAVLARRAERTGQPLALGRNGLPLSVRVMANGQTLVELPGRSVIDGIDALKTMTYQFESFSLDQVASELLGEQKLVHETDQLSAIKQLYREAPATLARYNYQDCVLVNKIAEHTQFVDFLILRSTLTGLDMTRPGGSVAAFINVYLPHLHRAGYISGVRPHNGGLASPGGYVMSSRPGLYDYVLVLDYKSLYPSIIRTFKIDPLGLAEGLANPDTAIAGFRGACFSRTAHFLPAIIENLWKQRDEAKKHNDQPRSQAIKILMNSFYGVLGSGGCPFYDPRLASSITLRGHQIMQTTAKWIEAAGHEVIYGDTDSTFVHLSGIQEREQAIHIGKALEAMINERWHDTLQHEFNLPCHLEIEFETCFDKFFMPTIRGSEQGSKKRYAGLTRHNGQHKLVFKGLENVRSDWTMMAKQFQETLYSLIFNDQPVEAFIKHTVAAIRNGEVDSQLIYRKRLRKPLNEYTRSVPPHVKAAQAAEIANQQLGRPAQYNSRSSVYYVITQAGPQAIDHQQARLDYEHYIEKQIRPIADSILPAIGLSFDALTDNQLGLF